MTAPERRKPAPPQSRPRATYSPDRRSQRHDDGSSETHGQLDLFAGRDQAEDNGDAWWFHLADQAIRDIAESGVEFQAFDLVERYALPEPDHHSRWGAALRRAARDGVIVAVGAAPSRRPTTCGSLTRTWRGACET